MYDLDKSREIFLKVGFILAAMEYSSIREIALPGFGLGMVRLSDFGISGIGGIMFLYLFVRWQIALLSHYDTLRSNAGQSSDLRKMFGEIVDNLKPLSWLELASLGFEIGAPLALTGWYIYLTASRPAKQLAQLCV